MGCASDDGVTAIGASVRHKAPPKVARVRGERDRKAGRILNIRECYRKMKTFARGTQRFVVGLMGASDGPHVYGAGAEDFGDLIYVGLKEVDRR